MLSSIVPPLQMFFALQCGSTFRVSNSLHVLNHLANKFVLHPQHCTMKLLRILFGFASHALLQMTRDNLMCVTFSAHLVIVPKGKLLFLSLKEKWIRFLASFFALLHVQLKVSKSSLLRLQTICRSSSSAEHADPAEMR